jgi:hypothetical protein
LAFTAQRTELAWQHSWDRRGVVRTTLKAGVELSRDNGSGYYDYRKGYGSAQLKVRWRGWALQTQGGLRLYDYDLETVSDQDPAKRKRFGVMAQVRLERKLSRHLVCFAAFEHEHMVARMAIDRYRVNSVFSGLEWELW